MKKICLITCYNQPDYIRARTLRAALSEIEEVELVVIKNSYTGLWRYPEVLYRVVKSRFTQRPDVYFITFRGYEILPLVRLITLGKPLVFDEFINLIEWVSYEHKKLRKTGFVATIFRLAYRFWLNTANLIVTDTASHAQLSSEIMNLPISKYAPLIVSTDETVFTPVEPKQKEPDAPFNVFYYGSMLPLQGVGTIIDAISILKDQNVQLTLIGGKGKVKNLVDVSVRIGVPIVYKEWVLFEELPSYIADADLCLGGPFGNTVQAQYVIGGKTFQFLQMGRPTVIGINKESSLWTDKVDSLLVEQGNPQALATAIMWAKEHPNELRAIGEAGQVLYTKQLSNTVLRRQLVGLLAHERLLEV